jgi:hypothetical protein
MSHHSSSGQKGCFQQSAWIGPPRHSSDQAVAFCPGGVASHGHGCSCLVSGLSSLLQGTHGQIQPHPHGPGGASALLGGWVLLPVHLHQQNNQVVGSHVLQRHLRGLMRGGPLHALGARGIPRGDAQDARASPPLPVHSPHTRRELQVVSSNVTPR